MNNAIINSSYGLISETNNRSKYNDIKDEKKNKVNVITCLLIINVNVLACIHFMPLVNVVKCVKFTTIEYKLDRGFNNIDKN